jgi:hypothetical protein
MSAVVLNQQSGNDQLYAGGLLTGARGVVCQKGGSGVNANGPINCQSSFSISDTDPAAPATQNPSAFTTFAAQTGGGGLNPNQLQKFAYADPRVSGPPTIQQYEQGYWSPTSTAFVAPALAVDTIFVNRPSYQPLPLASAATNKGTFTTAAAPVVVPAAGITAASQVRVMLVGGSAAAFTGAAAAGLPAPAITIQVGATTAASTFTVAAVAAGLVGFEYNWEILYA